ncbi:MAG: hypothetical protein M3O35_05735 [Acidobacteriota bacterium]|nr:hypothetical protein [Acidobacteriota bacterium]
MVNWPKPIHSGEPNEWDHPVPKVAAILSVVESCRRLRVPVKDYLMDVLPGIQGRKL